MISGEVILKKMSVQTVSVVIQALIQLVFIMVMSRLLTQRDFGIFAVVSGVQALAFVFSEAGIGASIVQTVNFNEKFRDTAFTTSFAFGALCSFALYLASDSIAAFNNEPALSAVIKISSLNIALNSICSVPRSILQREFQIRNISIASTIPMILSYLLFGFYLAYEGYGYWAMVWSTLANNLLRVICLFMICKPRPWFGFSRTEFKCMFKFSFGITCAQALNIFSGQIDKFILGALVSVSFLGAFTRIRELLTMAVRYFQMVIDMVMFPAIARVQLDIRKVREMYLKFRDISTSVSTVLAIYMYIFSGSIITMVLGSKWTYLDSSFKLLIISFGFGMETIFSSMFFRALGHLRKILVLRTVSCIFSASLLVVFARYGLVGIALGMSISTFLIWFIASMMALGVLEDTLRQVLLASINRFARIVLGFGLPLYLISLAVKFLKYNDMVSCGIELFLSATLLVFVVMKVPAIFGGPTISVLLRVCENTLGKKNIIYNQLAKAVMSFP